jgi:beta propeller repeat protein
MRTIEFPTPWSYRTKVLYLLIVCLFSLCFLLPTVNAVVDPHPGTSDETVEPPASEHEQPDFAPGEVIIKLKKNESPLELSTRLYATRIASDKSALATLKKNYNLRDEKPLFEALHNKLKGGRVNLKSPTVDLFPIYLLKTDADVVQTCAKLNQDPAVAYAEPNYTLSIDATIPNDTQFSDQWALDNTNDCDIDAPEAWDITTGSSDIIVAVVDTGIDYNHPELADNIWINENEAEGDANSDGYPGIGGMDDDADGLIDEDSQGNSRYLEDGATVNPEWINDIAADDDENGYADDIHGYDFCTSGQSRDSDPMDDRGHGTHCAGIIGARGNNNNGIAGVCWDVTLMALKFLPSSGGGQTADAVVAWYYAVDNGARIISNSFGGSGYSQATQDAVDYAYSQGVVMVASAGNDDSSGPHYPSHYNHVIAVAATDRDDQKASFSNYGERIDIAAPGVSVVSTTPDNSYTSWGGTSMACPHVAGVAALILTQAPQSTPEEVYQAITRFSDDLGEPGKDDIFGHGRVNAYLACMAPNASVSITSPAHRQYLHSPPGIDITGSASIDGTFQRYELCAVPKENPHNVIWSVSHNEPVVDGSLIPPGQNVWDTTQHSDGGYYLILKVFDVNNQMASCAREVIIDNVNEPPVFVSSDSVGAIIGEEMEYTIEARDPDDPETAEGQLTYSAGSLPPGARFDPGTQILRWQPSENDRGIHEATLTACDNANGFSRNHTIAICTAVVTRKHIATYHRYVGSWMTSCPVVQGDRIVWHDWISSGKFDIYRHTISTDDTLRVPLIHDGYNVHPDVYGDNVVWGRAGSVYLYDDSTGVTSALGEFEAGTNPRIHEHRIISRYYAGVKIYDIETGTSVPHPTSYVYADYTFWDDTIAWRGLDLTDGDYEIFVGDLSAAKTTQITHDRAYQGRPDISQGRLVWHDTRNGNYDIYAYDVSTGAETQITHGTTYELYPSIYKDSVVWDGLCNGSYEIFFYDMPTGFLFRITDEPGTQMYATIDGNRVVWVSRSPDEVYAIDMAEVYLYPQIDSVESKRVPQGTFGTIRGRCLGYGGGSSELVFANDVVADTIIAWSNSEITFLVPEGAASGPLKVITPGGESNGIDITIEPVPVLEVPAKVTTYILGHNKIRLRWQDNADNEEGFRIAYMPEGYPYRILAETGPDVTEYVHHVPADQGHKLITYWVYAYKGTDVSLPSNPVHINPSHRPTIHSFSPSGSGVSGSTVTITGYGFGSTPGRIYLYAISYDTNSAKPHKGYAELRSWKEDTIQCVVPDLAVGIYGVKVLAKHGRGITSKYKVIPATPQNMRATHNRVAPEHVLVNWDYDEDDAAEISGFRIYRWVIITSGNHLYSTITIWDPHARSYMDADLLDNDAVGGHEYTIQALKKLPSGVKLRSGRADCEVIIW